MGAWQEASKDLHDLLDLLADHKVAALDLARGREASENELAQMLSGYRRTLSTAAARANSGCLLGGKEEGVGVKGEERLQKEKRAHWRAHILAEESLYMLCDLQSLF